FFFSSRRRHTRFSRDWSSDACSSDLGSGGPGRSKSEALEEEDDEEIQEAGVGRRRRKGKAHATFRTHGGSRPAVSVSRVGCARQIGRASCRERVWSSGRGGTFKRNRS